VNCFVIFSPQIYTFFRNQEGKRIFFHYFCEIKLKHIIS
jgi:hypothetical protein